MNPIKTALAALAALLAAQAQTTPAVAPHEPARLSPFIIDASQDAGYAATQTLAGTR